MELQLWHIDAVRGPSTPSWPGLDPAIYPGSFVRGWPGRGPRMRATDRGARVPRSLAGGVAPGRGDGMWHSRCVSATVIDNPILNSPFAEPARHWVLDDNGIPTGVPADGRRRSEFIVPVPPRRHRVNRPSDPAGPLLTRTTA